VIAEWATPVRDLDEPVEAGLFVEIGPHVHGVEGVELFT